MQNVMWDVDLPPRENKLLLTDFEVGTRQEMILFNYDVRAFGAWHWVQAVDRSLARLAPQEIHDQMKGVHANYDLIQAVRLVSMCPFLRPDIMPLWWKAHSSQLQIDYPELTHWIVFMDRNYLSEDARFCTPTELSWWGRLRHRSEMAVELLHQEYHLKTNYGRTPSFETFCGIFRDMQMILDTDASACARRSANGEPQNHRRCEFKEQRFNAMETEKSVFNVCLASWYEANCGLSESKASEAELMKANAATAKATEDNAFMKIYNGYMIRCWFIVRSDTRITDPEVRKRARKGVKLL